LENQYLGVILIGLKYRQMIVRKNQTDQSESRGRGGRKPQLVKVIKS
jgi:hypothetical protein